MYILYVYLCFIYLKKTRLNLHLTYIFIMCWTKNDILKIKMKLKMKKLLTVLLIFICRVTLVAIWSDF